jgi:cysteine sulfinate desulfinase/cysteine desulfurase-like protein
MGLPAALQGGVLRVSLDDTTTADDTKAFVMHFIAVVTSEACLMADYRADA